MKLRITYDTNDTLEYDITKATMTTLRPFLNDPTRGTVVIGLSQHNCSLYLNKHRMKRVEVVWIEELEIKGL